MELRRGCSPDALKENELTAKPAARTEVAAVHNTDETPEGGYGWVCTGCVFTINCFSWGVISAYGVFLSYYLSRSTFPSAHPIDYAFTGGLTYGSAFLAAPLVNILARKYGTKPPMYAGVFLFGAGYVAASFATHIWHLYVTQGVLVGLGTGLVYIPSTAILPQWFSRRRSLANGIATAGSGIGGLVYSLATGAVVDAVSLPWALRITGITAAAALLGATALVRDRNREVGPALLAFDASLLRRPSVLLFLAWAFVVQFGYITLQYSLSDSGIAIGLGRARADQVTAFLSVATACGRPLIGVASDRFGRFEVAAALTCATGVLCFAAWVPARSFGALTVFALLSGGIYGVFYAVVAPLCAELVGLKDLPSLLAISWLTIVAPTTFAEAISLELRRSKGDREYLNAQIFSGVSYLVASGCLLAARMRQKRDIKRSESHM